MYIIYKQYSHIFVKSKEGSYRLLPLPLAFTIYFLNKTLNLS